jgi:CMP/dCMP kinase
MSSNIKIAISGKSGCGNTTVSAMVAEALDLTLINYTFHSIATEMGIDFDEVCRRAEVDTSFDYRIDKRQVELASSGNCVLGSRLAIWLLEDADLKFYLVADPQTRAQRIVQREGGEVTEVLAETQERDRRDRERYRKLYDIDTDQHEFVDMIVDAGRLDQFQITEMIVKMAKEKME